MTEEIKMKEFKFTEYDVKSCLNIILTDKKSYSTSLNYAINYIKEGLNMSGHDLAVQCLYILNNITHWRNPAAKPIRIVLKSFAKNN
mgnify:FL=1